MNIKPIDYIHEDEHEDSFKLALMCDDRVMQALLEFRRNGVGSTRPTRELMDAIDDLVERKTAGT